MDNRQYIRILKQVIAILKAAIFSLIILFILVLQMGYDLYENQFTSNRLAEDGMEAPEIVNGIHVQTGLIDDTGLDLVVQHCTPCHSAKLITQNRMTETGWKSTIKWMQETQNLWELGANEAPIIDYLATNYAPKKKGRRAQLENIEWYELE